MHARTPSTHILTPTMKTQACTPCGEIGGSEFGNVSSQTFANRARAGLIVSNTTVDRPATLKVPTAASSVCVCGRSWRRRMMTATMVVGVYDSGRGRRLKRQAVDGRARFCYSLTSVSEPPQLHAMPLALALRCIGHDWLACRPPVQLAPLRCRRRRCWRTSTA